MFGFDPSKALLVAHDDDDDVDGDEDIGFDDPSIINEDETGVISLAKQLVSQLYGISLKEDCPHWT